MAVVHAKNLKFRPLFLRDLGFFRSRLNDIQNNSDSVFVDFADSPHICVRCERSHRTKGFLGNLACLEEGKSRIDRLFYNELCRRLRSWVNVFWLLHPRNSWFMRLHDELVSNLLQFVRCIFLRLFWRATVLNRSHNLGRLTRVDQERLGLILYHSHGLGTCIGLNWRRSDHIVMTLRNRGVTFQAIWCLLWVEVCGLNRLKGYSILSLLRMLFFFSVIAYTR